MSLNVTAHSQLWEKTARRNNGAVRTGDADRVALGQIIRYAHQEAVHRGNAFTAHLLDLAEQSLETDLARLQRHRGGKKAP